ncbi:MAG: hypothetical protein A2821_02930 [Candidatus Magasanikbacteria bacterium RIFCSPHIGHO2_01_FULL_41_23]|uniref:HAD family hydrolase n=1 Tax=Candidatus Magasanikbacteria bacterium RIFCSPLOWO2_01_FULL_40_15 TaxID=1798686 RepID=A0A1F6N3K8_9BACT|nr:MAG: hypothetical protein A2821_02930 [Candidatus Magasanikbacteria bacterium RIFCSPHIGHO2_01_FULL_41_23]OGH67292.1 MAG: hypothetical protein A3C66_00945 [Candidatus Magasanikbacteria bacterium RIFCSPHIGHO2_02_FULL_41_35]OGH76517.1 MAG: hypothetical protein A3F22_00155 [Candidatus Magasanikbacteria bacterium RIFCSPHIGHO2_12_FULL_41_16]OGH78497.1 MAG: hypothetical protein A2983_03200 [Candidatus Magasanikbacteria bacterium RIFCSPLOWO2_01_FULL_40_15]
MSFATAPIFDQLELSEINRTIILDIDGTLVPDGEEDCSEKTRAKVMNLMKNNNVVLFSNSKNTERGKKMANALGISFLSADKNKPNPAVIMATGRRVGDCTVIGDKFLTDYLLAVFSGARFVPVRRIYSGRESFKIKIIYLVDDFFNFLSRLVGIG